MEQRTIVSIYEVDEWATTGPWAGQGSLVNPGIILVHPPLSDRIVEGKGPKRLRVGIFPSQELPGSAQVVEVIDVWGEPHILRQSPPEGPAVVALELRTPARSPENKIPDVEWTAHNERDYPAIAEHLRTLSQSDFGTAGVGDHSLLCKLFPPTCKHR